MSSPNWWGDWRPNLPAHSGNLQATDLIECTSIVGGLPVNTAITGQQIINAASGGGATWGSITGTLSSQTDLQTALNGKEPTITAGTTAQYYRGDKTFQTLDKSAVGLGNVDNTSDANKPISTATQTALNAKQDTLVSGTNIKTVNGNSLLGSGDVTISGGGNVGVHAILPLSSGQACSAIIAGIPLSSSGTIINRLYALPFIPNQNITTSGLFINVNTGLAGGLARILIFSNLNGLPNTKLYESANLDCSTTGIKTATTTFNFVAGTTYWLAFHSNNNLANLTFFTNQGLLPININSSTFVSTYVWATPTFGSVPSTFPTVTYQAGTLPYIGITKA
jgi:hypothetical protein